MKLNQKGFSIVELLIAMALTSIILTGIIYFVSTGSRTASMAENDVELQSEAQIIMTHITNIVLEGNYAEIIPTVTSHNDSMLRVYYFDTATKTSIREKFFIFKESEEKIYYYEVDSKNMTSSEITAMETKIRNVWTSDGTVVGSQDDLLCDYVKGFDADCSQSPKIQVTLKLFKQDKEVNLQEEILMRNKEFRDVPVSRLVNI
ncbi:PilW family protein [Anaeromicropila populeti]|uniref:Prepilin-type N-terminal cleavage/methylation domain-containing protein n=1 Tax=Anaeromicropila populeti TaxID=37658 RepID=A0A1I6IQ93_9FIRM|nr:prepilin-type N-terminal cleavage/methylation domain-containing protein [Anaeromicropila populeti]SFR68420.1 prepilin-type N-terminal cleavage/methylation domain-containing protein [Anaeromicropila populeti]